MKKIYLLLLLFVFCCYSSFSMAESLEEALVKAYKTNPKLDSVRKGTMATDELVPQALSGWRPTISAGGDISHTDNKTNPDFFTSGSNLSKAWDVSITQPVYKGGGTVSSTKSAKSTVKASHENLRTVENTILLSAVESYVDVIRDESILSLNIKNEEVLTKNLEAINARFEVGEVTITDVSQSEASLSDAKAKVINANGNLNISIANYVKIMGNYPKNLKTPEEHFAIPENKNDLIDLALINNPEVLSSIYLDEAALANISTAYADIYPEIDIKGKIDKTYDPYDSVDDSRNKSISASLTIPLYKSGSATSKIRQAKHTANQKRIEVVSKKRDVEASVISAWEVYEASKSNIQARKDQIKANEIALDGVEQEELVGARTILDVLDAENELLDSKVNLVTATRNKIYSYYFLISKIGLLTASDLNLPVEYFNPKDNYRKVKNKWWGTNIN